MRLLISLWSLFLGLGLFAQRPAYTDNLQAQWKFHHLTVDDGLSNNHVNCITRDSYGYVWIGTGFGLNRFNGIDVKKFYHIPGDSFSLISNYILRVFVDSEQNLWVATDKGLQQYDERLEHFKTINLPDGLAERVVFDITEDQAKTVVISSATGLFAYDLERNQVQELDIRSVGIPSDSVFRAVVDRKNNIWLTRLRHGLYYWDRTNNVSTHYKNEIAVNESLSDNKINSLFLDSKGDLWIGTQSAGVCRFLTNESRFKSYVVDADLPYSYKVRSTFEDIRGRIFVGTREGLFLFDEASETFSLYAFKSHKISQLSQNSVTYSHVDDQGNVWLGTHSGGMNYFNMNQKEFIHYPSILGDDRFLNTGSVQCFDKIGDKLYVGTERGLNILDIPSNRFEYMVNDPNNPSSLTYDDVKSIAIESPDRIWVGTNLGGINLINGKNEVVRTFRGTKGTARIPSDKVYNVFLDEEVNLWVISNDDWDRHDSVLSRYDRSSDRFVSYTGQFFMGIYQKPGGRMLVGGTYGFFAYNSDADSFREFRNDRLIYRVNGLYEDTLGRVWVGANSGLIRYDPVRNQFESVSGMHGIPLQEVYGILDYGDNLWVSASNGLFELSNIYDEKKLSFQLWDKNDGLQSREFNYNAYFKSEDGEFYFGGDNGFNVFYPDRINDNQFPPKVWISSLRIGGQAVSPGAKIDGQTILDQSIRFTDQLNLGYDMSTVRLTFDVLHYTNATSNKYKYRLLPKDTSWTFAGAFNNSITYHDLASGAYKFEVYGINSDGVESEQPAVLNIDIGVPFWASWWFRLSIVVFVLVLLFFYVRSRTVGLRRQKILLTRTVADRTKELLEEREQLEKTMNKLIESEKLASLGVFTAGVAHEINNPMNFIAGATHGLFQVVAHNKDNFDEEDQDAVMEYQELLKSGIDRIKGLLESLRNYTRADNGFFTRYNIVKSIEDAIVITENKIRGSVRLIRDYPEEVFIDCLPSRISQILINLIDNAADAIDDRGFIRIQVLEGDKTVKIMVEDSGVGISEEDQKHLFDPFFTTKEVGKGTGLGLYISHGYIMRHGGSIRVASELGKGTTFTIELPKHQAGN